MHVIILILTGHAFSYIFNGNISIIIGEPVVSVFMAPSVTPLRYTTTTSGHNPAVRLIKYDRNDGRPLDIINYYMDLDQSNKNDKSVWQLEYNMTSGYSIPDVMPSSLARVVERMKTDTAPLKNYNRWRIVNAPANVTAICDDNCFNEILCAFDHPNIEEFNKCMQNVSSGRWMKTVTVLVIGSFILCRLFQN